nr:CpXC domain-containing protein [Ardenticatena sp.]
MSAQHTTITCPQCRQPFTATVYDVIDVGQNPTLKESFLEGKVNSVTCPHCGMQGMLAIPFAYHDPQKELLLIYLPAELNLPMPEEEKIIGDLTRKVMQSLPAEQQKAYLLNPKRMLTIQSLIHAILEADGIDRKELERQTQLLQLLLDMVEKARAGDEDALHQLIDANKEKIDYTFMLMLSNMIQATVEQEDHEEEMVQALHTLRETLIQRLDLSPADVPKLGYEAMYDDVLAMLRDADPGRLQALVAANRPILDYGFFLHLTEKIENATSEEERAELLTLRDALVKLTDEMDAEAKQAVERAARQLEEILQADDIDKAVEERFHDLDEAFLVLLSANLQAAKEQKREDVAALMERIYEKVVTLAESRLPPEMQLINQLLRTPSAEERAALLREAFSTYTPDHIISLLETLFADAEQQGVTPRVLAQIDTIIQEAKTLAGKGA